MQPKPTVRNGLFLIFTKLSYLQKVKLMAGYVMIIKQYGQQKKNNGNHTILGSNGSNDAKLAKYTNEHNNEWHGYPVSPVRSGDKPTNKILEDWERKELISRPERRKINSGKW